MIVDPQLPWALWPVGKITEVFPGVDSRVRSATVEVKKNGTLDQYLVLLNFQPFLIRSNLL